MSESILTLNNLFDKALVNHSERVAFNYQEEKMTYNDFRIASNRLANYLKLNGVKPNVPVAILMPNCLEYPISLIGLHKAGGTRVALNAMLGENEMAYILEDSGAKVLIVEESFFQEIENIKSKLPGLTTIIGITRSGRLPAGFVSWDAIQADGLEQDPDVETSPSDIASISYTGGTTGNPKGVVHSHRKSAFLILSICLTSDILDDEKILVTTPLPHASGLYMMAGIIKGSEIFIESKFDEASVLKSIEENKITFTNMVPTMLYRIIDYMEDKNFDTSSLRTIIYGTAPITSKRLEQALNIFGPVFIQTYGLTETPGAVTELTKVEHKKMISNDSKRILSCGRSTSYSRIKIVDENGQEIERNVEGEIIIQSLVDLDSYHNLPCQTEETIKDGWVYTGDVGYMDEDGYVYILDRKKDMVISGGMNVYSSEVENVIQKHPKVRTVAVIGTPDDDWGEAVTAFIIPKDQYLRIEEIQEWCKGRLASYKQPKLIHFQDTLPLTPYGKLDKKLLREPYWQTAGRNV